MFGIIRPCRHRMGSELGAAWQAHLCGMCLALRDDHGQAARLVTNYDALVVSVLAEAQTVGPAARRPAGRCALRRMRRAQGSAGECARVAAALSLMLAAAEECGAGLAGTDPTETATAAVFAYTAVLAGRPGNRAALAEAGRLFGRVAHLLDAVQDLPADRADGKWNPLEATGTSNGEARRLCQDALLGIRLALAEAEFADRRLVCLLLEGELGRSVRCTFGHRARPLRPPARPVGRALTISPGMAAAADDPGDTPRSDAGMSGQPGHQAQGDLPPSAQHAAPPPPARRRDRDAWRDCSDCWPSLAP